MKNKTLSISLLAAILTLSLAFTAAAQTGGDSATRTPARINKTIDLSCVRSAVAKRETSIQSAFDAFSSAVKAALVTRASELDAAWQMTDRLQRRTAINAAWIKYAKSTRAASRTLRQARLSAWAQFSKDRKACGQGPTNEDVGADLSL